MEEGNRGESQVSIQEAVDRVAEFNARMDEVLKPIVDDLQVFLTGLEGKSFGSVKENDRIVRLITDLLNRIGKRVRCQKEGCGVPATLRLAGGGRTKSGSFQFQHFERGRTIHHLGPNTMPELRLVDAPPDPRRKR